MPNDKSQKQKFIDAARSTEGKTNENDFNSQIKSIAPKRKASTPAKSKK